MSSIGISWAPGTKMETLKALGEDHGVIVGEVKKDGPADKAGVKPDDIILAINGQPIKNGDELVALKIVLPEKPDPELESFVEKWGGAGAYNPRQAMEA